MHIEKILFLKSDHVVAKHVAEGLGILNAKNKEKFFAGSQPEEVLSKLNRSTTLFVSGNWFQDSDYRLGRIVTKVREVSPSSIIVGYSKYGTEDEIPKLDAFMFTDGVLPWKTSNDPLCQKLVSIGIHPCSYPILRFLQLPFDDMTRMDIIKFLKTTPDWKKEIMEL